jgi:hypothetical protein
MEVVKKMCYIVRAAKLIETVADLYKESNDDIIIITPKPRYNRIAV